MVDLYLYLWCLIYVQTKVITVVVHVWIYVHVFFRIYKIEYIDSCSMLLNCLYLLPWLLIFAGPLFCLRFLNWLQVQINSIALHLPMVRSSQVAAWFKISPP